MSVYFSASLMEATFDCHGSKTIAADGDDAAQVDQGIRQLREELGLLRHGERSPELLAAHRRHAIDSLGVGLLVDMRGVIPIARVVAVQVQLPIAQCVRQHHGREADRSSATDQRMSGMVLRQARIEALHILRVFLNARA
jgi:hypothetical protein